MAVKRRRTNLSNEKARLKYFLWFMIQRYQPTCYFCHQPFVYLDVLPPRGTDNLTEHHLNGDHQDMRLENRALAHRVCHKEYHVKDNILNKGEDMSKGLQSALGNNELLAMYGTDKFNMVWTYNQAWSKAVEQLHNAGGKDAESSLRLANLRQEMLQKHMTLHPEDTKWNNQITGGKLNGST